MADSGREAMLTVAIRDLDAAELAVLTHESATKARAAASLGRPRLAAYFQGLMVELAEESDRREELLAAHETDLGEDEEGDLVAPLPQSDGGGTYDDPR